MISSFSDEHGFKKPNDERALKLMDHAARDVMTEYKDILLAFGESDEFRYKLRNMMFEVPLKSNYQLPTQKINISIQSPSRQNSDNINIVIHFLLCFPLENLFPRYTLEIPTII